MQACIWANISKLERKTGQLKYMCDLKFIRNFKWMLPAALSSAITLSLFRSMFCHLNKFKGILR